MSAQEARMINCGDRTVQWNNSGRGTVPWCSGAAGSSEQSDAKQTRWDEWPGCFPKLTCQYIELLWQPEDLQFIGRVDRDKTLSHGCHYSGMGATNTWQPLLLQLVSFHAWRSKMHKRLICIVNLLVKYVCVLHFRWLKTSSSPPLKSILVNNVPSELAVILLVRRRTMMQGWRTGHILFAVKKKKKDRSLRKRNCYPSWKCS